MEMVKQHKFSCADSPCDFVFLYPLIKMGIKRLEPMGCMRWYTYKLNVIFDTEEYLSR
jgi:hypothetical protein